METFLYVADALAGDDDAALYKASDFLSLEIASATTVKLSFRAGVNSLARDIVTLTCTRTLEQGAGSNDFRQISQTISGLLNKKNGGVVVLADDVNSVYASPFFNGVVTAFADV